MMLNKNIKTNILHGDCRDVLKTLPAASVQCCVTSPPYYGLRDYGVDGQLGSEGSLQEYINNLIEVFRAVKRVLKDDGVLWLNLGDCYAGSGKGGQSQQKRSKNWQPEYINKNFIPCGLKPKDIMGVPWRVAFALQADGWYLRADIIWHKPNPMPESVTDRPTKSHEYIFLLTKNKDYYYDSEAIREPISPSYASDKRPHGVLRQRFYENSKYIKSGMIEKETGDIPLKERQDRRNKRSVWTVCTKPYPDAHFATYPPELIQPCVLAGSKAGDTILDPFNGSGTTGEVALSLSRGYIGIELNKEYIKLTEKRLSQATIGLPL